ncbi:hypothetical protein QJS10_CPB19g01973 [Acorus calamus]|uniref:Uncharacterized protein n=1 Tax=Acorus calamus TaxID=4465 RepID=A0AAV9CFY9_ACOCL|nr:hypothetical protein QJS10_CPB19g01973 [Acorus calamus]
MQSMEGSTKPIKLEEILSWAADLVQCLRTENDLTDLKKFAEGPRKLRDSCDAESEDVRRLIEDHVSND